MEHVNILCLRDEVAAEDDSQLPETVSEAADFVQYNPEIWDVEAMGLPLDVSKPVVYDPVMMEDSQVDPMMEDTTENESQISKSQKHVRKGALKKPKD